MKHYSKSNSNQLELIRSWLSQQPLKEISGKWYFKHVDKEHEITDSLDRIKFYFKQYPKLYYTLIELISPVYSDRKLLKKFLALCEKPVLNLGSGNEPRLIHSFNIDIIDYENVDIISDITNLPFCDNTVTSIMSVAVLEHVQNPTAVIQEIHRVLKPGGLVFSVIPFMQPFHASPHDYQRYTLSGIENLHRDFQVLESGVYSGPISGFLWVFQEMLASIFSFGSPTLRNILYISILLITFPIKFLDIFVAQLPTSKNLASNFYVIARKVS